MAFGGFGGNKVSVRIVGDKTDLDKKLRGAGKDVDQFGTKTQRNLKKVGTAVKAAFAVVATKAILDFANNAKRAFSDLNESTNAVEVTFGEAAEGIKALGTQAAETVGLSNAEFNTLAVGFSAFVDQIAGGGGDVVGVMETLTGRISDFASVMNLDVGEAAEKFRSGLAGETEPLRKFGIDVSAAAVKTKALALGLGDSSGKLSEQDKILARYQLIMDQTNKTAGDFANTIEDYANNARVAAARSEDLAAVVGESLVPAFQALDNLKVTAMKNIALAFLNITQLATDAEEASSDLARTLKSKVEVAAGGTLDSLEGYVEALSAAARRGQATEELMFDLAAVFELTEKDVLDLTKAVSKSDNAFDKSQLEVGALSRSLEVLAEWLAFVARKEAREAIPRTQEFRDAVLDGIDPALLLAESLEEVAVGLEDVKTEAERTEEALKNTQDRMQALTDPAFALIKAAQGYTQALETQTEALDDSASSNDDLVSAGIGVLETYQELLFAADEYANVTNTTVQSALLKMAETGQVPLKVVLLILEALNAADGFAGEMRLTLDYVEKNRAALERFLAINVGTGSPGSGVTAIPSPPDIGGVQHTGGRVNAPRGQEVLVRALGGEEFSNPSHNGGGGGGGGIINYYAGTQISNTRILRELVEMGRRR